MFFKEYDPNRWFEFCETMIGKNARDKNICFIYGWLHILFKWIVKNCFYWGDEYPPKIHVWDTILGEKIVIDGFSQMKRYLKICNNANEKCFLISVFRTLCKLILAPYLKHYFCPKNIYHLMLLIDKLITSAWLLTQIVHKNVTKSGNVNNDVNV